MSAEDLGSVAVVGGGMLGLTLAHRLRQQGRPVTLYEAAPTLGGLASAWSLTVDGEVRQFDTTFLVDSTGKISIQGEH